MSHLLCHGAAVDALDSWGLTPLMCAVAGDHGDAAGLLCDYGADVRCHIPEFDVYLTQSIRQLVA